MMSIVLSIYSENAYKEFVLPAASNTRTTLVVRRDVFGLGEDLELGLENEDGAWYFDAGSTPGLVDPQNRPRPILCNGDHYLYQPEGRTLLFLMITVTGQRFQSFPRYRLIRDSVLVGSDPDCGLCYTFESGGAQYLSRHHARIERRGSGLVLTDTSKNGVFVNDVRVREPVPLQFGDRIDIWGLNIVALGQVLAVRSNERLRIDPAQLASGDLPVQQLTEPQGEKQRYHRSPRRIARLVGGAVAIEPPPPPEQERRAPLLMTIGPALTMTLPMLAGSGVALLGASTGGAYMYTGIVTAGLSAVIGAVWALVNMRYGRKTRRENEARRFNAYSEYLIRTAARIREDYEENTRLMLKTYPSARQCLADGCKGQHLWERNPHHEDFLSFRLGLGDVPFQEEIQIPGDKFELYPDNLRDKPRLIRDNFRTLRQVPVCVDLRRERMVGLVGGPDRSGARGILYNLVAQIAVQNCYTDVKLAFLYQEDQGDDTEKWAWCHWLPHVWSESRKTRYLAANRSEASDVLYELAAVLRTRSEQASANNGSTLFRPWYIVVLEDASVLENEPIARYLLDPGVNLGVTTLFLADDAEQLPNACDCIIRNDAAYAGIYHARAADMESGRLQLETADARSLEQLARHLSDIEVNEIEVGGEIPNSITFFEMYGVARPEELNAPERWKHDRTYENMRALIGQKAGGQPCYLDVHEKYHGPHGLVAGTTGSGKSETLQTYILSLALNFSPYDVGLFIIDYKGGGMANLFAGLPHMLGSISNLSGRQIQRAMVSIKSENLRRQRIFNENGVNNINLYTTLYKNGEATQPVPHLFIIIDEFAELKREQPDFMRELISVAQVGRSLGVHLILATQKPSGTVDDNIWSNAKFRLCLRVQDRQDSMDMLHRPDAAYLTQAGRGFLQVGSDEVFEQFQSGWSGAVYDEATAGTKQVLAKMLTNPGKTALAGSYIKRRQKESIHAAWLGDLARLAGQVLDEYPGQDADQQDARTRRLYDLLAENRIDCPQGESNTRALHTLLELCAQARQAEIPAERLGRWMAEQQAARNLKLPEKKERTQLDAMVGYLADTARQLGYQPLPPLWLEPLPAELTLDQLDGWQQQCFDGRWPQHAARWELAALIGLADDPQNQSQQPVGINFTAGGHYALLGAASSGKSTFVQTLLYSLIQRFTPDYLNIYVLDFSSRMTQPLAGAPQVGGILFEDDLPRVGKLFYLMRTLLAERKQLFQGGDYQQYVLTNGVTCPAVLLVVDNIANFREKTQEAFDDELIRLAREGASYGIYLFITGGGFSISEIPSRLADQLRSSICLELSDIYQYADALRVPQPRTLPEQGVHGRGLTVVDGTVLEYQTALALPAADSYARGEQIAACCARMAAAWQGKPARPVPFIPEKPQWQDLMERPETAALLADDRHLPIGFDAETAGIYSIDLRYTYCYTVSGRARSGKTNLLRLFLRMGHARGMRLSVLEPDGTSLLGEATQLGADYCRTLDELYQFLMELGNTFRSRHAIQRELTAKGIEEDDVYARMCQEPAWLVVVADLAAFTERVTQADAVEKNMPRALENLIGKGFLHNIYFVGALDQNDRMRVAGTPVFEEFVKDGNGIHLGGNVSAQQLFEFTGMPFALQGKPEKPGVGLVPPRDGEPYRRVILPQVRG